MIILTKILTFTVRFIRHLIKYIKKENKFVYVIFIFKNLKTIINYLTLIMHDLKLFKFYWVFRLILKIISYINIILGLYIIFSFSEISFDFELLKRRIYYIYYKLMDNSSDNSSDNNSFF
jgi:hypothetical protein